MKKDEKIYNNEWVRGVAAALGVGGGLYALLRSPIHGSPLFKDLRAQYGTKMTIKNIMGQENIPFWKKLLSPYDSSIHIPMDATEDIIKSKYPFLRKGLNINNTMVDDPLTTIGGKTIYSDYSKRAPGVSYTIHRNAGLHNIMPEMQFKNANTDEELLKLLNDFPNHVFKPQRDARGKLANLYTTEKLRTNPELRKSLLDETRTAPLSQQIGIQPYLKGEEFRLTIVGDKVVPNATTTRHGTLSEGIKDIISPMRKRKMRNLETYIQTNLDKTPNEWKNFVNPKEGTPHLYGPDVIASFDDSGNVISANIIDLNMPALGHLTYQNNPIAAAKFYKQVSGRHPRNISLLAGGVAGTSAGAGTYFTSRKKKRPPKGSL